MCSDESSTDREWAKQLEGCLPGLRAYVAQRAGHHLLEQESIDDIVQSACREALSQADRLEKEDKQVEGSRAWLYWHATRKIIDKARQRQRKKRDPCRLESVSQESKRIAVDDLYRTTMGPENRAIQREDLRRLDQAIEMLPEQYSLVIRLAYYEGLTREEIAQLMGRPSSDAAQSLLNRAIAKLAVVMRDSDRSH